MRPEVLDYEILTKARDWLLDKKHWCRESLFEGPSIQNAEQTCALGAIGKVMGIENSDAIQRTHAADLLAQALPSKYGKVPAEIISYNDGQANHRGIIGLFTRALAKAKQLATAPLRG